MKNALRIYLTISSVILHILFIIGVIWFVPIVLESIRTMKKWSNAPSSAEIGVIKSMTTLEDRGYVYTGYAIEYQGKDLYIQGSNAEKFNTGERIRLNISKHPYGPINSLIITLSRLER
jgi:hypothetical protein